MTLKEILELIYNSGLQWDVYTFLHSAFIEDYGKMVDECRENNAIINAIRKINNGKNDCIDALCNKED